MKDKESDLSKEDVSVLNNYKRNGDRDFDPERDELGRVVEGSLGLGTMIGWKRIVVTAGEKIGKTHLTYGQIELNANRFGDLRRSMLS
jgi:PiT family inorganic phosphate transporter